MRRSPVRLTLTSPLAFPRPSGRGSIAASPRSRHDRHRSTSSPGHQAGAPLRPGYETPEPLGRPRWTTSPGHQAGAPLRRGHVMNLINNDEALPPAIRPGLHCGVFRDGTVQRLKGWLPPAIRPGLHCGRTARPPAPVRRGPSPGHQAGAPLRPHLVLTPHGLINDLPPAIRPGLHCGPHCRHAERRG